jgi:hypothetical protein
MGFVEGVYFSGDWGSYKHLIDTIKNIQRRYSKRIPNLSSLSFTEHLAALNFDPLELRRLRIDLIRKIITVVPHPRAVDSSIKQRIG